MPIIAIAIVIAAALGGGTAVAAQSSLPGDALWNFKTTVNENVQGAFAQGDEAKANWDIEVASNRLTEAQQLASEGKLSADNQTEIQANFDQHAKEVAVLVAKLQAQGKADVAAKIAAQFQATLAKGAQKISASASTTPALLTSVRGTLDAAATLSAQAAAEAQLRGGNAGDHPDQQAVDNANANARLEGGATTSSSTSAGATVHTGTSVRGGEGGIKTTEDGSVIGI